MRSEDKTSTYMRFPNQCGVWAQRTSGKIKLGTRNKGVVERTEEEGGTRQSKSNQMSLTGGHQQIRQLWVDFPYKEPEMFNKVLCRSTGESLLFSGFVASCHQRPDV